MIQLVLNFQVIMIKNKHFMINQMHRTFYVVCFFNTFGQ